VTALFSITPLGAQDRKGFSSGVEALDRYFHGQVGQDMRRRLTACYIATDIATGQIAGFYTLSAAEIVLLDVPEDLKRKLPRYPSVPVARLGRLAVDHRYRGQKLGGALLIDAASRAARSEIAVFALVVDAKDETAISFYQHYGFQTYGSLPDKLIASISIF
jgi:ribosomal protein S18 acetylase RimI-like enzyme